MLAIAKFHFWKKFRELWLLQIGYIETAIYFVVHDACTTVEFHFYKKKLDSFKFIATNWNICKNFLLFAVMEMLPPEVLYKYSKKAFEEKQSLQKKTNLQIFLQMVVR